MRDTQYYFFWRGRYSAIAPAAIATATPSTIKPVGGPLSTADGRARVGTKVGTGLFCAMTTGVGVKVVVGCEVSVGAGVSLGWLVGVAVGVVVGVCVGVGLQSGHDVPGDVCVSDVEANTVPGSGVTVLT